MGRFIIEGGHPLNGKLKVQGAKNAALPILAAGIMSRGEITLTNCPSIRDVDNMLEILGELGASAERQGDMIKLCPAKASRSVMPNRLSKELRSSIFMLGPLLSRFGRAVCTYPGGCEIGHRPIDLHLRGLAALGADIARRIVSDLGDVDLAIRIGKGFTRELSVAVVFVRVCVFSIAKAVFFVKLRQNKAVPKNYLALLDGDMRFLGSWVDDSG